MNKKIISVFLIILLISLVFINNNVFASSNKYYLGMYSNDDIITRVPETFLDLVYSSEQYASSNYFVMVTKNDITTYKVYFIPRIENLKIYCDGSYFYFSPTVPGVKVYKASDSEIGSLIGTYSFSKETYFHSSANLFYADFDVYTDSTYTDFFFKAPVKVILAPILEKVEMKGKMMTEILTLVPIMIVLLVSYLALRKGLAFIMTLRKM